MRLLFTNRLQFAAGPTQNGNNTTTLDKALVVARPNYDAWIAEKSEKLLKKIQSWAVKTFGV